MQKTWLYSTSKIFLKSNPKWRNYRRKLGFQVTIHRLQEHTSFFIPYLTKLLLRHGHLELTLVVNTAFQFDLRRLFCTWYINCILQNWRRSFIFFKDHYQLYSSCRKNCEMKSERFLYPTCLNAMSACNVTSSLLSHVFNTILRKKTATIDRKISYQFSQYFVR